LNLLKKYLKEKTDLIFYEPKNHKPINNKYHLDIYTYCVLRLDNPAFEINNGNPYFTEISTHIDNYFHNRLKRIEVSENEKKAFSVFYSSINDSFIDLKVSDPQLFLDKIVNEIDFFGNILPKEIESLKYFDNYLLGLERNSIKHFLSKAKRTDLLNYMDNCISNAKECFDKGEFLMAEEWYSFFIKEASICNLKRLNFESHNSIWHFYNSYHIDYLYSKLKNLKSNIKVGSVNDIYLKFENRIEINEELNLTKLHFQTYQSILRFGKYKSKTLGNVISIDKNYILWCIINLDYFMLPGDYFFGDLFANEFLYLDAFEFNTIKMDIYRTYFYEDDNESAYVSNENYQLDDSYDDGGGGDEWSDPSEFWG
jgi:hypothetical protein